MTGAAQRILDDERALERVLEHELVRADGLGRQDIALRPTPAPGSEAATDAAIHPFGPLVQAFAGGNLASGIEHLQVWGRMKRAGIHPPSAHIAVLRSALEGGATALWLLDLSMSPDERVARAALAQLHDYRERAKLEASAERDRRERGDDRWSRPAKGHTGAERLAEHEQRMWAAGLNVRAQWPGPVYFAGWQGRRRSTACSPGSRIGRSTRRRPPTSRSTRRSRRPRDSDGCAPRSTSRRA